MMKKRVACYAIVCISLLVAAVTKPAAAWHFTNWRHNPSEPGDWWEAANWDNGLPVNYDSIAIVDNGGTAVFSSGMSSFHAFSAGSYNNGTIIQNDGEMVLAGALCVGHDGTAATGRFELHGGSIISHDVQLADHDGGTAVFIHDAGLNQNGWISVWPGATYELSGTGVMRSEWLYIGSGRGISGVFHQTGGIVEITGRTLIASATVNDPGGHYVLSGGELYSDAFELGYFEPQGVMTQSGGTHVATTVLVRPMTRYEFNGGLLTVNDALEMAGTLVTRISENGINSIDVMGPAWLTGDWVVESVNAPFGRFSVINVGGTLTESFTSVMLPGDDWNWGIDSGTVWVEHILEPATLSLLALGGLALLRRKR